MVDFKDKANLIWKVANSYVVTIGNRITAKSFCL